MEFNDLSTREQPNESGQPEIYTLVGWLGGTLDFKTGNAPSDLTDKLFELCKMNKINEIRAIKPCRICYPTMNEWREAFMSGSFEKVQTITHMKTGEQLLLGSCDFIVKSNNKNFLSPSLILHYIDHHNYLPPQEFIDAALDS